LEKYYKIRAILPKKQYFLRKIAFFCKKYLQNKEKVVTLQAYSECGTPN